MCMTWPFKKVLLSCSFNAFFFASCACPVALFSLHRGWTAADDGGPVQAHRVSRGCPGSLPGHRPQLPQGHPRGQHLLRGLRAHEESPRGRVLKRE